MLENWAMQTPRNSTITRCSAPAVEGGSPRRARSLGTRRAALGRPIRGSWRATHRACWFLAFHIHFERGTRGDGGVRLGEKMLTGSRQSVANRRAYMAQTH